MRSLIFCLFVGGFGFPLSVVASESPSSPTQSGTSQLRSVKVKGLVCSFCAQGLVKSAKEHPSIAAAEVSLSKKTLDLVIKPSQSLSDEDIKMIVERAGFKVDSF